MPRPFNKGKTDSSTNCARKLDILMQKSEVILLPYNIYKKSTQNGSQT